MRVLSQIVIVIFLMLIGCSSDNDIYTDVVGRVETIGFGEGVADHVVTIRIRKVEGTGLFSRIVEIDKKVISTSENGNFTASLKTEENSFATITHKGSDDYSVSNIFTDYSLNEPILIKIHKLETVRVEVINTTPFDDNDYISLSEVTNSLSTLSEIRIANILNFGLPNEDRPDNPGFGHNGNTIWIGQNVHSIIEYKVPETTERLYLNWFVRKDGISNSGATLDIPLQSNQRNNFVFEY